MSLMSLSETANQKTFSIIAATYNCGEKIENTLQSILSQNKELFELIIIDGASSDETLDCIKKHEKDLTLISEKDAGVYYAFNKGINIATGRYIYFIGGGDCLRPGVLEQIKEFLPEQAPALVYGDFYLMKRKARETRKYSSSDFIFNNICHQSVFYHRAIFDIIGKYDLRYKVFADWVFNFKCFTSEEINKQYIPCLIADFEEGGLSSDLDNDPVFKKDFPKMVRRKLGIRAYLKCRTFMINPGAVSFGYKLLGHLNSFAGFFAYGYGHLKKAIRKR